MTIGNFRELLQNGNDIAVIATTLKNEILELTPKAIQEIKEDFISSGEFDSKLQYSKKSILSHYSNKLAGMLDIFITEQKNKDIKKSLSGLFKPLKDVLECRNWLIDLRYHSFDTITDKEGLIRFCNRITTSKSTDYFVIDETTFEKIGEIINYKSNRLFSITKIKELNGENNADGGSVHSASSLLQFLKNEVEANKIANLNKIKEFQNSLNVAKETLAQ